MPKSEREDPARGPSGAPERRGQATAREETGPQDAAHADGAGAGVLERLGVDITEIATARDALRIDLWAPERRRVMEVLGKRERHSAVLVGPEGVGKRALVVALARDIAEGACPKRIRGRRIIEIPFHRVVAAMRQESDFERIVFAILREAASRQNVILFLNQITGFLGLYGRQPGLLNAAYVLEMGCRQPGLYLVCTSLPDLHRRAAASFPWIERSLTRVNVPETTRDETIGLLSGIVGMLSDYHGVEIEDEAVTTAVDMSSYYIKERVLPGKAMELLDAAAAKVATSVVLDDVKPSVGAREVNEALSETVGIPTEKLQGALNGELLGLEDELRSRIKGQDHCVTKLADVIRVAKLGLDARPQRPDGVFLFVGPPGVGKSETASALADALYGGPGRLFEFNMARYSDDDSAARLVGVKLGEIDYEGDLTGAVSRHPHSVIVLEQIERTNRAAAVLLMQVFREGYLIDGRGSQISFSNATIILTSNSDNLVPVLEEDGGAVGFGQISSNRDERRVEAIRQAIEQFFPAEFMDGIDEVLVFTPLGEDALREIVQVHLDDVRSRLADRSVSLSVTEEAVATMVVKGHSREYGARNLGRTVEGLVLKPLARYILAHPEVKNVEVRVVEGDIEIAGLG